MDRDEEFYKTFTAFANESIGKEYKFSLRKVMKKTKTKAGD